MRIVAYLLWLVVVTGAICARAQQPEADEPLPVSVQAKPASAWTGRPVVLSGSSLATPTVGSVALTVRPQSGTSPAPVTLKANLDGSGEFSVSFTPAAAGTYRVDATAPDGRGHAQTTFQVQDPSQPNAATVGAISASVGDAIAIVQAVKSQAEQLPPAPSKQDLITAIGSLLPPLQALQSEAKSIQQPLTQLIQVSGQLQLTARINSERDDLLQDLAAAEAARQHTHDLLASLGGGLTRCDRLGASVDAIKYTGLMLDFAAGKPTDIAANLLRDVAGLLAAGGAQQLGGSSAAQSATSAVVRSEGLLSPTATATYEYEFKKLQLDANTIVSRMNDYALERVSQKLAQDCVQIAGPVTAHMHAEFFRSGAKWWDYTFDLTGRLTLRYPRDAGGDEIPVTGQLEGYGTNFHLWENAMTVLFPSLMSSAVVKKIIIPPIAIPPTSSGQLPVQYSAEGSIFGAQATPNAFFFQASGILSQDKLTVRVGAVRTDQNPKARVIVLMAPVITAGLPTYGGYTLPFKDAHFVFERAGNSEFEIPLQTTGDRMSGEQHFENRRGTADARGEYSVDIKVCNPAC